MKIVLLAPPSVEGYYIASLLVRGYKAVTIPAGDAPDFVEVGEVGIAVDDAMRHQRCLQLVW